MSDSTAHHEQSARHLAQETEQAVALRAKAMTEADEIKARAARESEAAIAASQQQATAMITRLNDQFEARKEQLMRDMAVLAQRKQSVLAQLANLTAPPPQSAREFTDQPVEGATTVLPAGQEEPHALQTQVAETQVLPVVAPDEQS